VDKKMNTAIASNEAITLPPLKWRVRHPKLYHDLILLRWGFMGLLPGIGMFIVFGLLREHHVPMTVLQVVAFLMAGSVTATFGLLWGTIVGFLELIAEKLHPEL
jgi:hypothetical protein